jgi:hypothetical protein
MPGQPFGGHTHTVWATSVFTVVLGHQPLNMKARGASRAQQDLRRMFYSLDVMTSAKLPYASVGNAIKVLYSQNADSEHPVPLQFARRPEHVADGRRDAQAEGAASVERGF